MVIQFKVKESKLTQLSAAWVVANSYNYVRAQFNFASNDWDDKPKTAVFMFNGREYPVTLDRNDSCRVPWEVLMPPQFYVYVLGGSVDSEMIATNSCPIDVHPSSSLNYYDNAARNPSPDIYQQILDLLQQKQDILTAGTNITIDENDVISATCGCEGGGDDEPVVESNIIYYGTYITDDESIIPVADGFESIEVSDAVFRFTVDTETAGEYMYFLGPASLGHYQFQDINSPFPGGWQALGHSNLEVNGQSIEYIAYKTDWDNLGEITWEVTIT